MNLLTIIVCAYLLLAALRGLKRGVVKTFVSVLMLLLILALTFLLTPLVSKVVAESRNLRTYYTGLAESFLTLFRASDGQISFNSLDLGGSLNESPFQAAAAVLPVLLKAAGSPELTTEKLVGFLIGVTATAITFVLVLWTKIRTGFL